MANPPILHHQNHLSLFHFRHSFTSLHFNKPLLFLPSSSSFSSSFSSLSEQQCNNHQVRRVSTVSCIEYIEFDKFGISNKSPSSTSVQADFPTNTNILYVDLHSAELIGSSSNVKSLPNMVLNTKKRIEYIDQYGDYHSVMGCRLECTMQNIADNFSNTFPSRCQGSLEDKLDTYIVYNERRRVTSSAKKKKPHASAALH